LAFNEVTERKYLELAPVTAVIVPHLFDKGYSSLLGSGQFLPTRHQLQKGSNRISKLNRLIFTERS
jgi:hypothetical protein